MAEITWTNKVLRLCQLDPWPRNPRQIRKDQAKRLGESINEDDDYLPGCGGIVTTVAKRVGCDWHTARKWIDNHDTLKAAFTDERERVLDLCETKLINAINSGDIDSAKWMLSRLGRGRGYVERQEHTGADGGAIKTEAKLVNDEQYNRAISTLADALRAGLSGSGTQGQGARLDELASENRALRLDNANLQGRLNQMQSDLSAASLKIEALEVENATLREELDGYKRGGKKSTGRLA
jgi:regulator of replication initiation timing